MARRSSTFSKEMQSQSGQYDSGLVPYNVVRSDAEETGRGGRISERPVKIDAEQAAPQQRQEQGNGHAKSENPGRLGSNRFEDVRYNNHSREMSNVYYGRNRSRFRYQITFPFVVNASRTCIEP